MATERGRGAARAGVRLTPLALCSAAIGNWFGSCALLALGAVGFWQTLGSAASLEARGVRPMIAAAAAPIWRALPEPPQVTPEQPALRVSLQRKSPARASSIQSTVIKAASPMVSSELVPAAIDAGDTVRLDATPEATAATAASAATQSEPGASAVDPVVGRYGL